MTYAAFRTSHKFHTSRPSCSNPGARYAWDELGKDGPIKSMRLLDGQWMCERPDGSLDEIEACRVREATRRR